MREKQLKLGEMNPTPQQLLDLFKISLSVFQIAKHDLSNRASTLGLNLQMIAEAIPGLNSPIASARRTERLQQFENALQRAIESSEELLASIDGLLEPHKPLTYDQQLVSRPDDIVRGIQQVQGNPSIGISRNSLRSLEIVFPENVLFGILSELVENALKANKTRGKVVISWKMRHNTFHCDVHDNGPGLVPKMPNRFLPLDALIRPSPLKVSNALGLQIVNRVLVLSKGLLLFSKSKVLGGTLAHFEFPVIGFYRR